MEGIEHLHAGLLLQTVGERLAKSCQRSRRPEQWLRGKGAAPTQRYVLPWEPAKPCLAAEQDQSPNQQNLPVLLLTKLRLWV